MTKSNIKRTQIKNYYRVKEALYKHFPKEAILDYPDQYLVYLHASYFFKEQGEVALLTYDQDRLLYPHHLDYVKNLPYYDYTGIACMDENNNVMVKSSDYINNLSPTSKEIEDICGFISHEILRMKEYIKLKKIKDDF